MALITRIREHLETVIAELQNPEYSKEQLAEDLKRINLALKDQEIIHHNLVSNLRSKTKELLLSD